MSEKMFAQVFWLVVFAVQAPLLGPYAFGLVTIVTALVGYSELVVGSTAADALISIRDIDDRHFSAVTTACSLVCVIFGIVVCAFANLLATAFGDTGLATIIRAMAVLPLIQAISIAPTAFAQREMQFRLMAIRTMVSLFAGGAVGLGLALAGVGVWALVYQALVQRTVAAIVLWMAVPLRFRIGISREHFRELARFAMPLVLARSMNWVQGQTPRLVLGAFLGPTDLGLFSLGLRLHDMVTQVAIGPKAMVARIDLRRYATDQDALGVAVRKVFYQTSFMAFPLCVGGASVMPVLFRAWLDPHWQGAIIPWQLLLLMAMPFVTYYVTTAVLLALNQQKWEAGMSIVQTVSALLVLAGSAPFGLNVVSAAIAVRAALLLPWPIFILCRHCGLRARDILLPQLPPLAASALMGVTVLFLKSELASAKITVMHELIILIAAGAVCYGIVLALLGPRPLIKAIRNLVHRLESRLIASLRLRKALRFLGVERILYYRRHRYFVRSTERFRRDWDTDAVVAMARRTNLVFSVTAGRTGTTFAQKLFGILPDVVSEHEPKPYFHTWLRTVEQQPDKAMEFLLHYKLPSIGDLRTPNYVELNHVFCKGFLEPTLALGITPNLLLLRRDPRLVALSYLERYTVPERTYYGMEWLLSPRYAKAMPLRGWERMTDYQLVFWYALEIERRQRHYSHMIQGHGGAVSDVTATELSDFGRFIQVARNLRLLGQDFDCDAIGRRHAEIVQVMWNRNSGSLWNYKGDLDRDEEEVWRAVSEPEPDLRSWVRRRYEALPVS
jgi:O-antigen/teichoic acid export membrane protein